MIVAVEQQTRERRCVLTGKSKAAAGLLRMVQGPDGCLVPDVKGKLPGRGVWVCCDKVLIEKALDNGSFIKAVGRALKQSGKKISLPENLTGLIEKLLAKQALSRLGIENKAAHIVCGFEKVRAELRGTPPPLLLVNACDGAADGKQKLGALAAANGVKVVEIFDRDELSLALGRTNVVHSLLLAGGAEKRLIADINRLAGFRLHAISGNADGSNNEE